MPVAACTLAAAWLACATAAVSALAGLMKLRVRAVVIAVVVVHLRVLCRMPLRSCLPVISGAVGIRLAT